VIENGSIPWIAFLSVVQNDGSRFHLLQQCRIRRPLPQLQNVPTTLKDLFFSYFLFICFFYYLFFISFNSEAMRYPCGTQLCVSQVMDEVTNTLLNA
jgi:hypothetical protein